MFTLLNQAAQFFIDQVLYPSFCAYCTVLLPQDTVLCDVCAAQVKPIFSHDIMITPTKKMTVYAASAYQDPLKSLILAKLHSHSLASIQLARIMVSKTILTTYQADVIVPIPLHWSRYMWRGYNQAELIAAHIAQHTKKPMMHILKRAKKTPFQSSIVPQERMANVKDCFVVDMSLQEHIAGKHIILIDDLMTTGSTLTAAAKTLLPFKPASIATFVACRVV